VRAKKTLKSVKNASRDGQNHSPDVRVAQPPGLHYSYDAEHALQCINKIGSNLLHIHLCV